jgi:hypothetical protein
MIDDGKKRDGSILDTAKQVASDALKKTAEDISAVIVTRAAEGTGELVANVAARAGRGGKRNRGGKAGTTAKKAAKNKKKAKKKTSKKLPARKGTKKKASRKKRI